MSSRRDFLGTSVAAALTTATALAQTPDNTRHAEQDHSASNPGQSNEPLRRIHPSSDAPPPTDHGIPGPFWHSFDLTHRRIQGGGWTHQVTERELPLSKEIAGVNMRLTRGSLPRAPLAPRRRVGPHAHRPRPRHPLHRPTAPPSSTTSRRRPLALPRRRPALHPGHRRRWLRVPPRLQPGQLLRGDHLPPLRLAHAHPTRRARQKLRPHPGRHRQAPQGRPALHLSQSSHPRKRLPPTAPKQPAIRQAHKLPTPFAPAHAAHQIHAHGTVKIIDSRTSPPRPTSPPPSSPSSPAACASSTGTPTPASGSSGSRARAA